MKLIFFPADSHISEVYCYLYENFVPHTLDLTVTSVYFTDQVSISTTRLFWLIFLNESVIRIFIYSVIKACVCIFVKRLLAKKLLVKFRWNSLQISISTTCLQTDFWSTFFSVTQLLFKFDKTNGVNKIFLSQCCSQLNLKICLSHRLEGWSSK